LNKIKFFSYVILVFVCHTTYAQQDHVITFKNGICFDNDSPINRYKSGWDIKKNKRSRYKTRSGREKVVSKVGNTEVFGTLSHGYTSPHIVTAKKGDIINFHLTSLIREKSLQEFSIKQFGVNELLSPGETKNITFKANTTGVFKIYSKKHCTNIETLHVSYLVIGDSGVSTKSLIENIHRYTQADYNKQLKVNRENENQDLINSFVGNITRHSKSYKSVPVVVEMLTSLTNFLGYANAYKKKYIKFANLSDWDNAYLFAKKYQQYKLMAQEKGELALSYLENEKTILIASKPVIINNSVDLSSTGTMEEINKKEIKREKERQLALQKIEEEKAAFNKSLKLSGLSLITKVKKVQKGQRYVPSVTNTYYTTEDHSYTVNGKYVSKLKSNKNYTSDGGYNVDVKGFDLIFAVDNESTQAYIVTLEVNWNNTELYYAKESYCMQRGWFFCSQSGKRYSEKERSSSKTFQKKYIVGSGGRIKHRIYIGEKKPNLGDLTYKIIDFKAINKDLLNKMQFINSQKGLEKYQVSQNYFTELKKNILLSDFHDSLSKRMDVISRFQKDKFNSKHISLAKIAFEFGKKFDPDFDNKVIVTLLSKQPLLIDLSTPQGKKNKLEVLKKEKSPWGINYCMSCEYSLKLSLNAISGLSKKEIKEQTKIEYVYSPENK
jgi:hypothetical protein